MWNYCKELEEHCRGKDDIISNLTALLEKERDVKKREKEATELGSKFELGSQKHYTCLIICVVSETIPYYAPTHILQSPSKSNKIVHATETTSPNPHKQQVIKVLSSPEKRNKTKITHTIVKDIEEKTAYTPTINSSNTWQYCLSPEYQGLSNYNPKENCNNQQAIYLNILFMWMRTGTSNIDNKDNKIQFTKVWDNRQTHKISILHSRNNSILLCYKINSTLKYIPSVKTFRVRYQGDSTFTKIPVNVGKCIQYLTNDI